MDPDHRKIKGGGLFTLKRKRKGKKRFSHPRETYGGNREVVPNYMDNAA